MKRIILIFCACALCVVASAEPKSTVERRKPLTANVGIVGVGLDTYWKQFEGLKDVMLKKLNTFENKVKSNGVKTFSFGLVDNARARHSTKSSGRTSTFSLSIW